MASRQIEDEARKRMKKQPKYFEQVQVAMEYSIEVAAALEEMAPGKHQDKQEKLEANFRELVAMENRFRDNILCLKEAQAVAASGSNPDTDWELMLKESYDTLREDAAHTAERNQAVEEKVKGLKKRVWDVNHYGQTNPGDEDSEEEIAIVKETVSFMCPLSTELLVKPVKNPSCGHFYSEAAVNGYIANFKKQRKRKKDKETIDCPVPGCPSSITETSLEKDIAMERALQKHLRERESGHGSTPGGGGKEEVEGELDLTQNPDF